MRVIGERQRTGRAASTSISHPANTAGSGSGGTGESPSAIRRAQTQARGAPGQSFSSHSSTPAEANLAVLPPPLLLRPPPCLPSRARPPIHGRLRREIGEERGERYESRAGALVAVDGEISWSSVHPVFWERFPPHPPSLRPITLSSPTPTLRPHAACSSGGGRLAKRPRQSSFRRVHSGGPSHLPFTQRVPSRRREDGSWGVGSPGCTCHLVSPLSQAD